MQVTYNQIVERIGDLTGINPRVVQTMVFESQKSNSSSSQSTSRANTLKSIRESLKRYEVELSEAATIEEVSFIYNETPDGSIVREKALEKWVDICRNSLSRASTLSEITEVYNKTPNNTSVKLEALEKFKRVFRETLEKTTTISEAESLYAQHFIDNKSRTLAGEKLHEIYLRKLSRAKSIDEILEIYKKREFCPYDITVRSIKRLYDVLNN